MAKVTIVIPVYNVIGYISDCINSVLAQNYQDYKVILVDDGSTDGSGKICDEFASKDDRIKVIHKENGGLSSARNAAEEHIDTEFIFYLDSDDLMVENSLENLIDLQEKSDADIVIGNYTYLHDDHEDIAKQPLGKILMSGYDALSELAKGNIQNFAWGKLIRSSIALNERFPEGKLFEDHFWTHHILADAVKVAITDRPVVQYRQRSSSISYNFNLKRMDIVDGWRNRAEFFRTEYPDLFEIYLKTVSPLYINLAWAVCRNMKKDKKKAILILKEFDKDYRLESFASEEDAKIIRALQKDNLSFTVQMIRRRIGLK